MKILKTPWKNELMELVSKSKKSIKITSPFVKENICNELILNKKSETLLELVTSFNLMNIYRGSLDLNGLEKIINNNGVVRNFSKLHSKIYLFDDEKAIITSGNLTNGGLLNNYEYGLYIDDTDMVSIVSKDFAHICKNKDVGTVTLSNINTVRDILFKISSSEPVKLPKFETESSENIGVIEISDKIITPVLSGWKLEVFKCIQLIPSQIFSLREINEFEIHLKNIYPNNNTILDKIRQQLQNLRDLGMIEFLGKGQYRKLWK